MIFLNYPAIQLTNSDGADWLHLVYGKQVLCSNFAKYLLTVPLSRGPSVSRHNTNAS